MPVEEILRVWRLSGSILMASVSGRQVMRGQSATLRQVKAGRRASTCLARLEKEERRLRER